MQEEKRLLFVTPQQVRLSIKKPEDVYMRFDIDPKESGLLGIDLVLCMSPTEARHIGNMLIRKADEAEAGTSRA